VYVKDGGNTSRHDRLEGSQAKSKLLNGNDVHTRAEDVAHQDAGEGNADQEEEREVVVGQGDVIHRFDQETAEQQSHQADENQRIGHVERQLRGGMEGKAVKCFQRMDRERYRYQKKAHMPKQNDQHTVMKENAEEPKPASGSIGQLRARLDAGLGVAPEGTEEDDLHEHPAQYFRVVRRSLELIPLHPRHGVALPAGGGDAERHRRFGPIKNPPAEAADKEKQGRVGYGNTEKVLHTGDRGPYPRNQRQGDDCNQGEGVLH